MALGSGNLPPAGDAEFTARGYGSSPSGFTFRLRFRVFTVRTIDTDSRVARQPGQLTQPRVASLRQRGSRRAHVVVARVSPHENGELFRFRRGTAGTAP